MYWTRTGYHSVGFVQSEEQCVFQRLPEASVLQRPLALVSNCHSVSYRRELLLPDIPPPNLLMPSQ